MDKIGTRSIIVRLLSEPQPHKHITAGRKERKAVVKSFRLEPGKFSVRGKSGQRSDLPLSAEVGKAIAAYLRHGRPQNTSRRVFLRAKAPVRGFLGQSGVGSIVRHRLLRAGLDAPTYGAHQFRHGLATELLRQGASLSEIGELLGHRSPETTKIYIKVDLQALRTLALPWPGGVR